MRALEGLKLERDDGEKRPKNPAQRKLRTTRTGSAASKVRLLTFDALDGRSVAAKYAQETRAAIEADLGGPDRLSTLERLQVENAALDAAVLRDLQIKWLKGEDINIGDLIAIENVFNRTAAALGTTRRPKEVLDIDTYLQKGADDAG